MCPTFIRPSGCNLQEISIVGKNGRFFFAGVDQLLFIGETQIAHISGGKGVHPSSFQAFRNGDVCAFVCIDPDLAHGPKKLLRGFSASAGR